MSPRTATSIPDYMVDRVRRPALREPWVVPDSTPVVSFGNAQEARVATLGLNPSRKEFSADDGSPLTGEKQRFATLSSLGLSSLEDASNEQVRTVVEWCDDYFHRRPFWTWFRPLQTLVQTATGATYEDGSACHLDLVQTATDPVWGGLSAAAKSQLITADQEFLRHQLTWEKIEVVLLNGKSVNDQVKKMGVQLDDREPLVLDRLRSKIVVGEAMGSTFVGWSANLQGSRGLTNTFRRALAERVRDEIQANATTPTTSTSAGGVLARGTRFVSTADLTAALQKWCQSTSDPAIGEVGRYGGKAWLALDLGDERVVLNADTTRAAVADYLAYASGPQGGSPWRVITNRRGTANKVAYRTDTPVPGWYCYLSRPRTHPGSL